MIPQLHRYLEFHTLKNWKLLSEVGQDMIDIVNDGDLPLELGDVANIKSSHRNTEPIPCPPNYLDVIHMDIRYGDCKSIGGAYYVLLLVDRATHFSWVYALWSLNHSMLPPLAGSLKMALWNGHGRLPWLWHSLTSWTCRCHMNIGIGLYTMLFKSPIIFQAQSMALQLLLLSWFMGSNLIIMFYFIYSLQDSSAMFMMVFVLEMVLRIKQFRALSSDDVANQMASSFAVHTLIRFTTLLITSLMKVRAHLILLI